jgi:porin
MFDHRSMLAQGRIAEHPSGRLERRTRYPPAVRLGKQGGAVRPIYRSGPFTSSIVLVGLALLLASGPAGAQPYPVPQTWGGDFSTRPRLTGDWGGARDELGKKGVVIDVDLTVTPMDVLSGGKSTGGHTWGNVDYTLNVDTQKLGLWPGGFLNVAVDTSFGTALNNSGTIAPVNTAFLIPESNVHTTALMGATFMQFLSEKFGLILGKVDTLTSGQLEFYGNYQTQFVNAAFNFPLTAAFVPISAFGGGVIALPTKDISLSLVALSSDGTPTNNNLGDAFSKGAMVVGGGAVTIHPFGLVGHQNLSILWSSQDRLSLEQNPRDLALLLLQTRYPKLGDPGAILGQILEQFFPDLGTPVSLNRKSSSWAAGYGFDQYLWQPAGDSQHGIGVFFSVNASDANPNPIKYSFLAGLGGKGVGTSRPDDTFGLAVERTQFSSAFIPFLRQRLDLGLDHEDAIEAYYNFAITGWLSATADLQIVNSGLNKTLNSSGTGLMNIDTTVIAGIRIRARF